MRSRGHAVANFATVCDLGDVVPNDRFYIHNRALPPSVNVARWALSVSGDGVSKPQSFTYAQLTDPAQFEPVTIPWTAQPGQYRVMSRATDDQGDTQPAPEDVPWNQLGLHYNGIVRHPVEVLPMSTMP